MAKGIVMKPPSSEPARPPIPVFTVAGPGVAQAPDAPPVVLAITPILLVADLRPSLAFWVEGLGFTAVKVVPGNNGEPIFAILEREGVRLMVQTRASVIAELPSLNSAKTGENAVLFLQVPSLKDIRKVISGRKFPANILQGPRNTPHGTQEMSILVQGVGILVFSAPLP